MKIHDGNGGWCCAVCPWIFHSINRWNLWKLTNWLCWKCICALVFCYVSFRNCCSKKFFRKKKIKKNIRETTSDVIAGGIFSFLFQDWNLKGPQAFISNASCDVDQRPWWIPNAEAYFFKKSRRLKCKIEWIATMSLIQFNLESLCFIPFWIWMMKWW